MLQLFGWVGTSATSAHAPVVRYLTEAAARQPALAAVAQLPAAHGDSWFACGPSVEQTHGLAAVLRGQPVWRTSDPRILGARSPAHAVIEAYRSLGMGFLEVLHGDFAVAVIDSAANTTVLAVDRMGVERMTYARDGDELVFATSADVVAHRPAATPRVRPQALLSYLFFHMIPSPETVFEGVRKIPPATAVILRDRRLEERVYWKPSFVNGAGDSYASLAERLHGALRVAVETARPDDTTGAFLSGGLDSSTVAGYLGKVTGRPARTFSMGFGFDAYDELRYARLANAHFGCEGREYEVRADDISDLLPLIARSYDEPFGNSSALPTFCCARFAREHGMTHLLAGDGGDEIFAGNKRYAEQRTLERYQSVPRLVRAGLLEPVLDHGWVDALPLVRKARGYIVQAKTSLPDRLESWNFMQRLGMNTILHPDFAGSVDTAAPLNHMRAVYASAPPAALVDRLLHYDWRFTLADNDLRKVGTMCELAGVRVSYPMLHPDVVDVAIGVPADLKMQGTELRSFYKRAMSDFLPAPIINKTKHGFGLPFGLWLRDSPRLADLIDANLAGMRSRGVFRPAFLDELRRRHRDEDANYYGGFIWVVAMLEQWFREHAMSP